MRLMISCLAALALHTGAGAHDFWIEATDWTPNSGQSIGVRLRVGDGLQGEAVRRDPARIERFVAYDPGVEGETPVTGEGGAEPAGTITFLTPGVGTLVYRSRPAFITLEAKEFHAYLEEEGLEHVIKARAGAGSSETPGREMFSRCCKALALVGDGPREGFDREVGLRLELTPVSTQASEQAPGAAGLAAGANPFARRASEPFAVRLTFEGRALEGALVHASQPGAQTLGARTDAHGVALLPIGAEGFWLITAVHMIAVDSPDADWESLWASLTFEARAAAE